MVERMRPAFLLVLPLLLAPSPQPPTAVLAGVITRDVADGQPPGAPLRGVTVAVAGVERRAATDAGGRFVLGGLPVGTREVVVRAAGFAPVAVQAELAAGDTTWIDFALAPTDVARASAAARDTAGADAGLADFERRRASGGGGGVYITRARLQRFIGRRLSDVLRPIPGVMIVSVGGGTVAASRRGRTTALSNTVCYLQVFVGGVRVYAYDPASPDAPPNLDQFDPANLAGVEVYPGGARTPPELNATGAGCGTLVLWPQTPS
jgi:hypothetical protein